MYSNLFSRIRQSGSTIVRFGSQINFSNRFDYSIPFRADRKHTHVLFFCTVFRPHLHSDEMQMFSFSRTVFAVPFIGHANGSAELMLPDRSIYRISALEGEKLGVQRSYVDDCRFSDFISGNPLSFSGWNDLGVWWKFESKEFSRISSEVYSGIKCNREKSLASTG